MPDDWSLRPVSRMELPAALDRLYQLRSDDERLQAVAAALAGADSGEQDFSGMVAVYRGQQPVLYVLTVLQTDGTLLVWPPARATTDSLRDSPQSTTTTGVTDESRALRCVRDWMLARARAPEVRMIQALIEDPATEVAGDSADSVTDLSLDAQVAANQSAIAAFTDWGLEKIAHLEYLIRPLSGHLADDLSANLGASGRLEVELYDDSLNSLRFAEVIEASYVGSLDCPAIMGRRKGVEALASHRLSGEFTPTGWALFHDQAVTVGVCLVNDHPEHNGSELVYLGIVPEHRGRGLGAELVGWAIAGATNRGRSWILVAVDSTNLYAKALYDRFHFTVLARRQVWARFNDTCR